MKSEVLHDINQEPQINRKKNRIGKLLGSLVGKTTVENQTPGAEKPRMLIDVKSGETSPIELHLTNELRKDIHTLSEKIFDNVKLHHAVQMSESGNVSDTKHVTINGHEVVANRISNEYGSNESLAIRKGDEFTVFQRVSEAEYPYEALRVYAVKSDQPNKTDLLYPTNATTLVDAWGVSASGAMYEGVSDNSELLTSLIGADEILKQIES